MAKRKDSGSECARLFNKDVLPLIGTLQLEDVKRAHVMEVLDAIVKRGANRMANRALSEMRQMFTYAELRELIDTDPTYKIRRKAVGGQDNERDRFLSDEEIRLLAVAVPVNGQAHTDGSARLELPTRAAIWLMLATMTRVGALATMRWQDIDFEARTWTIPDSYAKGGRGYLIHLSDFAMQQIERLRQPREYAREKLIYVPDPVWVFPASRKEGSLCVKTLQKQINDRQRETPMRNRTTQHDTLKLPGGRWTAHDLRRTGASFMSRLKVRGSVIDKAMGHVEENKIRRIYERDELLDERQEAFALLGRHLDLLTRTDTGNVVMLRRA